MDDQQLKPCACPVGECRATDKTVQGTLLVEDGKFKGMWVNGGVHTAICRSYTEFSEAKRKSEEGKGENIVSIKPAA